ncbi:MAG: DUF805 domain-containing protein [Candidatus Eremiobacteraeota bacterium]|nr:DUF805 domain-containing protein [Candidatus Eremiobacteraeota bacterium]
MHWYLSVLKNYTGFHGRARRAEFWWFTLFNIIIIAVLELVGSLIGGMTGSGNGPVVAGALAGIYSLAVLLPTIAVSIRRLHDTDKSGWWILLNFVPFGAIVLLIFYILDGTPGPNQYGPNPKDLVATATA